jgi:hypothetical protein
MIQEWDFSDQAERGQSAGKRPRGEGRCLGCIAPAFPRSSTWPLSDSATLSIISCRPSHRPHPRLILHHCLLLDLTHPSSVYVTLTSEKARTEVGERGLEGQSCAAPDILVPRWERRASGGERPIQGYAPSAVYRRLRRVRTGHASAPLPTLGFPRIRVSLSHGHCETHPSRTKGSGATRSPGPSPHERTVFNHSTPRIPLQQTRLNQRPARPDDPWSRPRSCIVGFGWKERIVIEIISALYTLPWA